jgi:hypothetical protein
MVGDYVGRKSRGLGGDLIEGDDRLVGVLLGMYSVTQLDPDGGGWLTTGTFIPLQFTTCSSAPPYHAITDLHDHNEIT